MEKVSPRAGVMSVDHLAIRASDGDCAFAGILTWDNKTITRKNNNRDFFFMLCSLTRLCILLGNLVVNRCFYNFTVQQMDNVRSKLRHTRVVGNHQNRPPGLIERCQNFHDAEPDRRVEIAGGFISQDE